MGFKRMEKMETTEPSVDEVGKGMKKGGKAKMADGGMPMGALPAAAAAAPAMARRRAMPARRPNPRAAMMEAAAAEQAAARPMMRKNGGSIYNEKEEIKRVKDELKSNRKEERNEHEEIGRVKRELKSHEAMKASKAHKGLATGGVVNGQGGYKKGGIAKYATGGIIQKYATGGVVNGQGGYKEGGFAKMMCEGGSGHKAMKKGGSW
jgi:hypothetical protein